MTPEDMASRLEALEARLAARDAEATPAPALSPHALYRADEVAAVLRCKLANVYQLAETKALAVVRVGANNKGLRFKGADVLAFIESRRGGGPRPRMAYKTLGL